MAFAGQLSTENFHHGFTTSFFFFFFFFYPLFSCRENLVQNAPSRNIRIHVSQFLPFSLSLSFFPLYFFFQNTWHMADVVNNVWYLCIREKFEGERKGTKKCHEAVIKTTAFKETRELFERVPPPPPWLKSPVVVVKNISWPRRHPPYERA